jgi:hydroxyacylglutathione hydrolase
MNVVTFESPDIGDRSYLVHDTRSGVVIDPQRDIDRVLDHASRLGVSVTHVLETHIHNDYVSGGLHMARLTGARYVISADELVVYAGSRLGVRGGDSIRSGSLDITVIPTPGHTPHHIAYSIRDGTGDAALFSGGSLLFGSAGRTDLFSRSATEMQTRAQWRSIRRLASSLGPDTALYPTHGFGSFCAAGTVAAGGGTIGAEWSHNPALLHEEDAFVKEVVGSLGPPPSYYAYMAPLNRRGDHSAVDSRVVTISLEDAARGAANGRLVVDVRPRREFAAGHISGSTNIEWGDNFAAYFGWSTPWGMPVTLVGVDTETILKAASSLSRLGIDDVRSAVIDRDALEPGVVPLMECYPVSDFAGLLSERTAGRAVIVDAREKQEWERSHIEGALSMPFHCAEAGTALLPDESVTWVHCARGLRAAIAASILDRLGRDVVLVDDVFENAVALGLTTS